MPITTSWSQRAIHAEAAPEIYRIGRFTFRLAAAELSLDGVVVELRSRATQVLAYLVSNQGRFVSRDELLRHIWSDVSVTEGSLTQAVWEIRRTLGDSRASPRFIETQYGVGYRLAAVCIAAPCEPQGEPPPEQIAPSAFGIGASSSVRQ